MKKQLSLFVTLPFICSAIALPAFADAGVSYNPSTGIVTVKGNTEGYVSITALPGSLAEFDTSITPVAFETVNADGNWSVQFSLASTCADGTYTVFVSSLGSANEVETFDYVAPTGSGTDTKVKEAVSAVYASLKGASATDAANILYVNAELLGIDDDYFTDTRLSASAKAKAMSALTSATSVEALVNQEGDINTVLDKASLLGALSVAKTSTDVKQLMTTTFADEAEYLFDNCPNYKSTIQTKIIEKFATYRSKLSSIDDLQKYFNQAAKEVVASTDKPTSTSGGGGGGGGGGASSSSSASSTNYKLPVKDLATWLVEAFSVTDKATIIETITGFLK